MKVALVCIAKNEDNYIKEWVEYHLKLGFDHIFIYENDWKCKLLHPNITKIPFPGKNKQLVAYNDFIVRYDRTYNYVAFLDVDEFLVLKRHKNVKDFITQCGNPAGIGINWQIYGANGLYKRNNDYPNSVIKQFTRRQNGVNMHIKSIIQLTPYTKTRMVLPHNPNKMLMDTSGVYFKGPYNKNGSSNVAVINHYFLRTFADWKEKCQRGRADCNLTYPLNQWEKEKVKNCEIEDLIAFQFMYGEAENRSPAPMPITIAKEKNPVIKELTVVIPNKSEETPLLTIESLYNQTFKNFDIIIVNDFECNANAARNRGFKDVKTPYVLFSDNDINWDPDALQLMVNCLEQNPEVSIAYGSFDLEGNILSKEEWDTEALKRRNYISAMSMVRTAHHPGFDESIKRLQDWDVWLTMIEQGRIGKHINAQIFTTPKRINGISRNSIPLDEATKIVKDKHNLNTKNDTWAMSEIEQSVNPKEPISIIITAYKSEEFIEECLDSIERQTHFQNNDNFEILVGVDGCQTTLKKLMEIRYKYRNLRIFMMKNNKGTYVTSNTLLDLVKYENIIRFDSDDVMTLEMVRKILVRAQNNEVVMFGFHYFVNNVNEITDKSVLEVNSKGVIFYKKSIIDMTGGYQDWLCAADSEMLNRVIDRVNYYEIEEPLYYKRNHKGCLTNSPTLGWGTKTRNKYKKLSRHYNINEEIKIKKVVNEYTEINEITTPISFCIPAYKSQNFIEECLDSIDHQYCEKEILVGIDGCSETLSKIKEIFHKYKNLRVFWFPQNVGTSIVKNTLVTYAKHEIISFFDSDDIMNDHYCRHVLDNINEDNIVRFWYQDYNDKTKEINLRNWCANGIMTIYKDNFLKLNGFWEHRVTEDWDFMERWKMIGKDTQLQVYGFKRRVHDNNISYDTETGCYGSYGANLLKLSKERCDNNEIKNTRLIVSTCDEIYYTINDYFDKIYCLNLDRRKDKWVSVKKRFNELQINVERFSAIDGNTLTEEELIKYDKINKYEIGCTLSHYQIIKNAKENNYKRILIFEDDVLFIDDFHLLFRDKISKLENWKLFYLGGSQWQWGDIEFINGFYYTNHTDGTFAYAVDESIYDEILSTIRINDKPIDFKLWDIQKKFDKQCYTSFPNLVISDVSSSDIRESREIIAHGERMRWDLTKYKRK